MARSPAPFSLAIDLTGHAGSLQRALYEALREALTSGQLQPGARLPSSRELARQLELARGTVVAVYAQLTSEGYLAGQLGAGTFVAAELPDRWFSVPASERNVTSREASTPRLSRWGSALVDSPFGLDVRRAARPFRPHIPAVDAFPSELWQRLLARRARNDERLLLGDVDVRGYRPLREQLAEHLRSARGVVCSAEQLVILPSAQQALDLVGRLTLDVGAKVWLEEPGYPGARAVFGALGAKLVPVPVDEHGLDVAAAMARAPDARLAYVTPGRQAPLGVTLSMERRLSLLAWASARGALVVEDDYDSEYRYEGRPVPALQGLDRTGVVVHVGTFSKTLLPSLRLAYALLPESLLERFLIAKSIVDRFTPPLSQAVLADFMAAGHFGRHLRRMRELYGERREALLSALSQELGEDCSIVGASAGLDLTLRFARRRDDRKICTALAEATIEALPLSLQGVGRRSPTGLLLGFAAFSPARLKKSAAMLARVLTRERAG